jgi:hypothetical protein
MLQIKCSCGRIAEVRHRRNGKKLAYRHCDECGTDLGNKAKAAVIEAQAKEDIGVKGEFFKSVSNNSSKTVQDKQSKDFKPEQNDLPENLESDIIKNEIENEEIQVKTGNGLKFVVGFFGAALIGGGIYAASKV